MVWGAWLFIFSSVLEKLITLFTIQKISVTLLSLSIWNLHNLRNQRATFTPTDCTDDTESFCNLNYNICGYPRNLWEILSTRSTQILLFALNQATCILSCCFRNVCFIFRFGNKGMGGRRYLDNFAFNVFVSWHITIRSAITLMVQEPTLIMALALTIIKTVQPHDLTTVVSGLVVWIFGDSG